MIQKHRRNLCEDCNMEEKKYCRRSRKKKGWVFGGRQLAVLCLGAAVAGGAAVSIFQKMDLQSQVCADEADETSDSIVRLDWDGDQSDPIFYQTVSTAGSARTAGGMDVSDIAAAALPSVVSITNSSVQEVQRFYDRFGRNGQGPSILKETTSCGSGVIIAEANGALYMVTNYHVVEGATTISVGFADGTVCTAELCGTDSNLDLAVLKVPADALTAETLGQIAVASIGDSNSLRVGEQVVAIGNALGYGQSVTTGIVSALNRVITSGTDSSGNTISSNYVQTDAAINPGNSGGALLNMNGELIGINTAKTASTDVEGMGYAIPITDVWEVILNLMTQTTINTKGLHSYSF